MRRILLKKPSRIFAPRQLSDLGLNAYHTCAATSHGSGSVAFPTKALKFVNAPEADWKPPLVTGRHKKCTEFRKSCGARFDLRTENPTYENRSSTDRNRGNYRTGSANPPSQKNSGTDRLLRKIEESRSVCIAIRGAIWLRDRAAIRGRA